ncbi:MAG: hypothetical protein BroJett015_47690 [Chloroflexota bacterium]|nr:MAG: hypothetical protein BroJett015_47690 [Chloroflexota bacterium]
MSSYKLIAIERDPDAVIRYNLICDGEIILTSVPYRVGIDYVYCFMNNGDTFQEIYQSTDQSMVLTYDQIQNSLGKKEFERRLQKRKS